MERRSRALVARSGRRQPDDARVREAIDAAAGGDKDASTYLYVRFADEIHAELVRGGADDQTAVAAVAETLEAHVVQESYGHAEAFEVWLVNRAGEHARRAVSASRQPDGTADRVD